MKTLGLSLALALVIASSGVGRAEPQPRPGDETANSSGLPALIEGPAAKETGAKPTLQEKPRRAKQQPYPPVSRAETIGNQLRLALNAGLSGMVAYRIAEQLGSLADFTSVAETAGITYLLASGASALFHWGVDNFGKADPKTLLGSVIWAFRDHHKHPRLVGEEPLSHVTKAGQKAGVPLLLALAAVPLGLDGDTAALVAINAAIYTSWIHALAHRPKSKLNPIVRGLQRIHLFLPHKNHGAHHQHLHKNYDVLSGLMNYVIPEKAFSAAEFALHKGTGVVPVTWNETPDAERLAFKTGRLFKPAGVAHRLRAVPRLARRALHSIRAPHR